MTEPKFVFNKLGGGPTPDAETRDRAIADARACEQRCAELEQAIANMMQYVVAWRYEYADKPNDAHNNAQRDRIDATLATARALLARGK